MLSSVYFLQNSQISFLFCLNNLEKCKFFLTSLIILEDLVVKSPSTLSVLLSPMMNMSFFISKLSSNMYWFCSSSSSSLEFQSSPIVPGSKRLLSLLLPVTVCLMIILVARNAKIKTMKNTASPPRVRLISKPNDSVIPPRLVY